jgi:hypothetical protein
MDMIVVADAGMLSAANLVAIEDAGFNFIVGQRLSKTATTDLQDHFDKHGEYFDDGQILESRRVTGAGKICGNAGWSTSTYSNVPRKMTEPSINSSSRKTHHRSSRPIGGHAILKSYQSYENPQPGHHQPGTASGKPKRIRDQHEHRRHRRE